MNLIKKLSCAALALLSSAVMAATLNSVQLLNPTGSTSGQAIVSTGASTAPAWGNVAATSLAAQAANTVLANVTASSASPTAFAMPSCSTSTSALQYTNGTGFTCFSGSAPLASPALTGAPTITNSATSGNTLAISATSNTSGAAINLQGNGGSTPNKTIRVSSGLFQIVNSANSTVIFSMDDSGNTTVGGNLSVTSGAITPSQTAGIVGTTTNNNANAGSVGEYVNYSTAGTSLSNGIPANCASTTTPLSAGDWLVSGTVQFVPAGSTTVSAAFASIGTTSATLGGLTGGQTGMQASFTTGQQQYISPRSVRIKLASATTVYLVGSLGFGTSTATCSGWIEATRLR